MIIEFDGEIFRWDAREDAAWFFTAVPPELSEEIREIPRPYRGFGSVRVRARIGGSEWSTSIFPDSTNGSYCAAAEEEGPGCRVPRRRWPGVGAA